jgi:NTP pyrophosphatase (non-canonical NTP hydrolase)
LFYREEAGVPNINDITVRQVQDRIKLLYGAKDEARGVNGTFLWFMEEVGELASALRGGESAEEVAAEFADVQAWLATLANIAGVDLGAAVSKKYGLACPGCRKEPCACPPHEKP